MAVTRVTHSTKGFEAINYALNGKPHVANKFIPSRVLTSSGINCTVHDCRIQMNAVWKHYGINRPTRRHRRQVQRLIQSFDPKQLDYRNPKDVAKANAIGRKLASKLYPRRQSIVITQADNKRHILHNHIITNMIDFTTGRSMTGQETSWRHVQIESDRVIKDDFGLNPEANKRMIETANGRQPEAKVHRTDSEYHIRKQAKYSWVHDIRSRISRSLIKDESTNWKTFIQNCHNRGVKADPFRKYRGGIRKDKDGHPLLKKQTSFIFKDRSGQTRHIRDRKLGSAFVPKFIARQFQKNITKRQEEAQRKQVQQKQHVINHQKRMLKRQRAFQRHNIKIQAIAEQRKVELKKEKIKKLKQRKIEHERKRQEQLRQQRKLLQRQRSRRITQIQSAAKKSNTLINQATTEIRQYPRSVQIQSTITESSKIFNQSTQEGRRHQRQPAFNRKMAKKPFRRLLSRFKGFKSSIKKNGGLHQIITRYLPEIHKVWGNVRHRVKRVINQIKKLNHKYRQQQEQQANPIYSQQSFDTDNYGHIRPTGDHLELYVRKAFALPWNNHIHIAVIPYYRRDVSKHYKGQFVCHCYSYRYHRYNNFQWLNLRDFNKMLAFNNQEPINANKISHRGNLVINGNKGMRSPVTFTSTVFSSRHSGRQFIIQDISPSRYSFSYEHEIQLNQKWHEEHDFNLARSFYWQPYSQFYYQQNGKRPNPHKKSYLSDFQTLVVKSIRSEEQQHNQQYFTPKNQIERKIDERVNADPNDAQNYTHPWYVRGFDVPQDSGPQF